MKRILVLMLVLVAGLVTAKEKKSKPREGPYIFKSTLAAEVLKPLIIQHNLGMGYTMDHDSQFQLRFYEQAQMPFFAQFLRVPQACLYLTQRKLWLYTLTETSGVTTVTVQPFWEYPGDYCILQTRPMVWKEEWEIEAFKAMLNRAEVQARNAETNQPPTAASRRDH